MELNLVSNIQNNFSYAPKINGVKKAMPNDSFEKTNSISFTSKYIMDVNLKRRSTKNPIKAQVRELDFSKEDDRLIFNLGTMWSKALYIDSIIKNYFKGGKNKFYIVTTGNNEDVKAKDVKSILYFKDTTKNGKKECSLEFIQAAPEIADNEKSSIKGSGEVIVYALVKHAKETGCERINLTSTNNEFYENLGFEMGVKKDFTKAGTPFYLDKKDYDWFLSKVEKKYGFKN